MSDFDDFHKLALDLTEAPKAAIPNIVKSVGFSANVGKKAWQADARKHHRTPGYPASIDYDTVKLRGGTVETEVGPNLGRGVGTPSFGILEDADGGVRGTPRRSYVAAENAIEADLPQGIEKAIDQALKASGL